MCFFFQNILEFAPPRPPCSLSTFVLLIYFGAAFGFPPPGIPFLRGSPTLRNKNLLTLGPPYSPIWITSVVPPHPGILTIFFPDNRVFVLSFFFLLCIAATLPRPDFPRRYLAYTRFSRSPTPVAPCVSCKGVPLGIMLIVVQ